MRIRELEKEWTMAFTDGPGLEDKAAGGFCANPNRLDKDRQPDLSGDQYLGIKATHFGGFGGELAGIALALEGHNEMDTGMLALLSDCKPAIRVERMERGP